MADAYGDLSDLQILESDPALPPAPAEISSLGSESLDSSASDGQENATLPADEAAPSPDETQTTPEATQQEQAQAPTEQPSPEDDSWVEEVFRAYPQFAKQLKAFHEEYKFFDETFGSVANARLTKQALDQVGGIETIKQLKTVNEGISAVDKVYYGSDSAAKQEYLAGIQRQNPQAFSSAVFTGLNILKQSNPQYYEYLTAPYIAASLDQDLMVWHWLEHLNKAAEKNGDLETVRRLNEFAGVLHAKYGLGPNLPEVPEAAERRATFHAEVGRVVGEQVDAGIAQCISQELPNASPEIKAALVTQAHAGLLNLVRSDKHLLVALSNSFRRAPSGKLGNRMVELLVQNLWPHIPRIVSFLTKEHLPKPAPAKSKSKSEARQPEQKLPKPDLSKLTGRQILDLPENTAAAARAVPKGMVMTRSQVKQSRSDFRKLLDDSITVAGE